MCRPSGSVCPPIVTPEHSIFCLFFCTSFVVLASRFDLAGRVQPFQPESVARPSSPNPALSQTCLISINTLPMTVPRLRHGVNKLYSGEVKLGSHFLTDFRSSKVEPVLRLYQHNPLASSCVASQFMSLRVRCIVVAGCGQLTRYSHPQSGGGRGAGDRCERQ